MFGLVIILLLLGVIGSSRGIVLMIDSPTPKLFRPVALPKTWRIYHSAGHAFVEFKLGNREAKLVAHLPDDQISIKVYENRFPCPSYDDEDVMTWILVVLPGREAIREKVSVEKWLRNTKFKDDSETSLTKWLGGRKPTDLFIVAIMYVLNESPLKRNGYPKVEEMVELCKISPWEEDEDEDEDNDENPISLGGGSDHSPESTLDSIEMDLGDEVDERREESDG